MSNCSVIKLWLVLLFAVSAMFACSVETDNEAEASVSYYGLCESIEFSDSLDVVYAKYIEQLVMSERMPLTGERSVFVEEAKTSDGFVQNAIYKCHVQAIDTYDNVLKNVSAEFMRSQLTAVYGDSVDVSELDRFTIDYALYAVLEEGNKIIATYSKEY